MTSPRVVTDLAVIIVSYNARRDLEACLASIHAAPPAVSHQIVVVDNASADGSAEAVAARWPRVLVVQAGENLGFARATNVGIRRTDSELLLLLNGDTIVPPGAIDSLVRILRSRDGLAVVAPRLVDAHGAAELSFGRMWGPLAELRQKIIGRHYARGSRWAAAYVTRHTTREHSPDWVSGACLLVWRRVAESVGLLDERFLLYGEDVDFCAAIRGQGRRILFTPSVEVLHRRGQSTAADPEAAWRMYRRSQIAFYAKHHPTWLPWLRLYLRLKGKLPE